MREIINGETYDTEEQGTKLIASHDCPGVACNELRYWEEDLYLTDSGRWFLHGTGGPLTLWSDLDGTGNRIQGTRIEPMTEERASRWLQDAGEVEVWRRHFGRRHTNG